MIKLTHVIVLTHTDTERSYQSPCDDKLDSSNISNRYVPRWCQVVFEVFSF